MLEFACSKFVICCDIKAPTFKYLKDSSSILKLVDIISSNLPSSALMLAYKNCVCSVNIKSAFSILIYVKKSFIQPGQIPWNVFENFYAEIRVSWFLFFSNILLANFEFLGSTENVVSLTVKNFFIKRRQSDIVIISSWIWISRCLSLTAINYIVRGR